MGVDRPNQHSHIPELPKIKTFGCSTDGAARNKSDAETVLHSDLSKFSPSREVALLEKQIAFEPHLTSTATSKFLQPAWHGFRLYRRNLDQPANRIQSHPVALGLPLSIPAET